MVSVFLTLGENGLCWRFWLITVRTNKCGIHQSQKIGKKKRETANHLEKGNRGCFACYRYILPDKSVASRIIHNRAAQRL